MPTFHAIIAPGIRQNFSIDWAPVLDTGETLASVSWTVPEPLVISSEANTATLASMAISGAVLGQQYVITCEISTNLGSPPYTDKRSLLLTCVDR